MFWGKGRIFETTKEIKGVFKCSVKFGERLARRQQVSTLDKMT